MTKMNIQIYPVMNMNILVTTAKQDPPNELSPMPHLSEKEIKAAAYTLCRSICMLMKALKHPSTIVAGHASGKMRFWCLHPGLVNPVMDPVLIQQT